MSRHRRRLERLEGQLPEPVDEEAALRQAILRDIMNEFGRLKGSRAVYYRDRGRRDPEDDIPGRILGSGYTTAEMLELAVRRVFERAGHADEGLIKSWSEGIQHQLTRITGSREWDKVEGGRG